MEEEKRRRFESKEKKKGKMKKIIVFFLIVGIAISIFVVYQYSVGKNLAKSGNVPEEEDFAGDELDGKTINVLLMGIDSREGEQSRTDTMMLVSWNTDQNDVKLVSFMRDIYADIPGYRKYKLNTAYFLGGVQLTKDTITSMFDIPIHHYAVIDFQNFESLIDILAPNGIEIDVEKDMSAHIDVNLKEGLHKLNGKELLGYARFRMDAEGDFGRVRRQQQVIDALKDELFSLSTAVNLPKFIGAANGYIATDMTPKDQLAYVLRAAAGGGVTMTSLTIPAEGEYILNKYPQVGEVIELDKQANTQILHDFLEIQ